MNYFLSINTEIKNECHDCICRKGEVIVLLKKETLNSIMHKNLPITVKFPNNFCRFRPFMKVIRIWILSREAILS